MAARKKSASKKSPSRKSTARKQSSRKGRSARAPSDVLAMLRQDHQKVMELFDKFEKTRQDERKQALAQQICMELTVHAQLEEELFYPALREAIRQTDLIDEADVEHQSAKELIAKIQGSSAGDDMFDAQVKVLGEYVRHHVKEEQGEIFAQARKSKLDLKAMGEQAMTRKQELMQELGAGGGASSRGGRSRSRGASSGSESQEGGEE